MVVLKPSCLVDRVSETGWWSEASALDGRFVKTYPLLMSTGTGHTEMG